MAFEENVLVRSVYIYIKDYGRDVDTNRIWMHNFKYLQTFDGMRETLSW